MRQSDLFSKTLREPPRDEEAVNAKLLIRAGFVSKEMAGVYSYLPLGLRVINKIANIVREEMNAIGGQEVFLSALQPKENWEKTGRWQTFDALFKVRDREGREEALGSTHDEIITPIVGKNVGSYKDLPVYVYQIQTKFRDEPRPKSGLLRGREFLMKDLYSFHTDQKDLDRYYEVVKRAYFNVYKRLGIGQLTYLTFASGATFAKYSDEFQTLSETGEDTIHLCLKCKIAVNHEIFGDQKSCPECGNLKLETKRAIEVGNIFKQGTRFPKVFGLTYRDASGTERDVYMGAYGIGISRNMGAIVEVSHDEDGIIWPESVAPFKIHLLELEKRKGNKLYQQLTKMGEDVLYDDREATPGEKFSDADLIGIPYRAVVSGRTGTKVELKKRGDKKIRLVKNEFLAKLL